MNVSGKKQKTKKKTEKRLSEHLKNLIVNSVSAAKMKLTMPSHLHSTVDHDAPT